MLECGDPDPDPVPGQDNPYVRTVCFPRGTGAGTSGPKQYAWRMHRSWYFWRSTPKQVLAGWRPSSRLLMRTPGWQLDRKLATATSLFGSPTQLPFATIRLVNRRQSVRRRNRCHFTILPIAARSSYNTIATWSAYSRRKYFSSGDCAPMDFVSCSSLPAKCSTTMKRRFPRYGCLRLTCSVPLS